LEALSVNEFEIDETPRTLSAWTSEPPDKRLALIESDVRSLMRELAASKTVNAELDKQRVNETRRLLISIVEAIDAFERVFQSIREKDQLVTPQMKIWIGNFRTVRRLLEAILANHDVVKIENLDAGFDPRWHRVAETVKDAAKADGTIVEEVVRGYVWKGQVLRKAEVLVVKNSEDELPGAGEESASDGEDDRH
jgi:molecular chaperone GrpE